MYMYIFEDVGQLTDDYHPGGGLVVIAENWDDVLALIREENTRTRGDHIQITEEEIENAKVYVLHSDYTRDSRQLFIFPDGSYC